MVTWGIVAAAVGCFFGMFVLQAIVARIIKIKSEDKFIIGLFVGFPALVMVGMMVASQTVPGFWPLEDIVLTYLLFFVIASSWVASYPAVYASCPTLIMSYIIANRPEGTARADFHKWLKLKENSVERIDDAMRESLIRLKGQNVELTGTGRAMYLFFSNYKRFLGLHRETL